MSTYLHLKYFFSYFKTIYPWEGYISLFIKVMSSVNKSEDRDNAEQYNSRKHLVN